MYKAIQHIQLRTLLKNYDSALHALNFCRENGIEAIELNNFMLSPLPLTIRLFTKLMGMEMGRGSHLDWHKLIDQSGLKVISLHCDLGSLEKNLDEIVTKAKSFDTNIIVLTGMYNFDYSDIYQVNDLINKMNIVGKKLKEKEIDFLYHNHNCEFIRLENGLTAYEQIVNNTDPEYVNFELDVYWLQESGSDVSYWIKRLNKRIKLCHLNDRGNIKKGKRNSIVKAEALELGLGNMNLDEYIELLKDYDCRAVVLERQNNWIDNNPLKSVVISMAYLNKTIGEKV